MNNLVDVKDIQTSRGDFQILQNKHPLQTIHVASSRPELSA